MKPIQTIALVAVAIANAATFSVGPGLTYSTPRSVAGLVAAGDTVLIEPGDYPDEVATWSKDSLVLRGNSRYAHMIAPSTIPNGKAIWVISGNRITVENIEFSGASVPDQNGAGIRAEGDGLSVLHSYFHDNENGILGGKGHVRIENSIFAFNGYGDGYSHNLYIANCDTLTFAYNYTHGARIGHEIKSRAKVNFILYNRINNGSDGTASYEVDLPNGGESYLIGNLIQQGPLTDNPTIVTYGEEGLSNPSQSVYLSHNTIVNDRSSGGTFLRFASGSDAHTVNNLYIGNGSWISGNAQSASDLLGSETDVVNRSAYDYHLSQNSSALDAGSVPGNAGMSLVPLWEYLDTAAVSLRTNDLSPDVGAYGYNSTPNSVVFPDRTGNTGIILRSQERTYQANGSIAKSARGMAPIFQLQH